MSNFNNELDDILAVLKGLTDSIPVKLSYNINADNFTAAQSIVDTIITTNDNKKVISINVNLDSKSDNLCSNNSNIVLSDKCVISGIVQAFSFNPDLQAWNVSLNCGNDSFVTLVLSDNAFIPDINLHSFVKCNVSFKNSDSDDSPYYLLFVPTKEDILQHIPANKFNLSQD